jgi:sugar (pentulose or hexulose) kinase
MAMEQKYILAADVGTSSVKTGLFDLSLNLLKQTRATHDYVTRGVEVEIDPETLFDSFLRSLEGLKEYLPQVVAMGFSAICPNMILMDKSGKALANGILHLDRRSEKQGFEILEKVGLEKFLSVAGNVPCPGGMTVTSLMWLRENRPDAYENMHRFGHTTTFLIRKLTGNFIIDPPNAAFNGLYDTVGNTGWSEEMCERLGFSTNILPTVRNGYEEAGRLTKEASQLTGLPEGTLVVTGGADTACSVFGAGCVSDGQLLNTTGTVEALCLCSARPNFTGKYLLRPACNPGHWLVMNMIGAGGESLNWYYRVFCHDMDKDTFFHKFLPEALRRSDTGVEMTPHLAGDRTCVANKAAVITGLTLSTRREDILLALLQGLVKQLADGMDDFARISKLSDTIIYTGGGAQALLDLKKKVFHQFHFVPMDDCAMKGIAKLIKSAIFSRSTTSSSGLGNFISHIPPG